MKLSIIIVAIICSLISATSAKLGGNVAGVDDGRKLGKSGKSGKGDKKRNEVVDGGRSLKALKSGKDAKRNFVVDGGTFS